MTLFEEDPRACPIEKIVLSGDIADEKLVLAEKLMIRQAEEAYEELGDQMAPGEMMVSECVDELGLQGMIDTKTANAIGGAVVRCFQKRYLGECQTGEGCKGYTTVTELISKLELNKLVSHPSF